MFGGEELDHYTSGTYTPSWEVSRFNHNMWYMLREPTNCANPSFTVGHWARDALLCRVRHRQRHPRRGRRALLPQNVDGVDCVGHRLANHLLGLVSSQLS